MANKRDFIASGPTDPDLPTSKHDLSYTNNFTASFGTVYPVGIWYMPAHRYFKCNVTYGFDLQPLVFPVQTNMRMHIKFYSAPLRILWKSWKNWFSRGGQGYEMPYIHRDFNYYKTGSLADYIGLPSFKTKPRTHEVTVPFGITRIGQSHVSDKLGTSGSLYTPYSGSIVELFNEPAATLTPESRLAFTAVSQPLFTDGKPVVFPRQMKLIQTSSSSSIPSAKITIALCVKLGSIDNGLIESYKVFRYHTLSKSTDASSEHYALTHESINTSQPTLWRNTLIVDFASLFSNFTDFEAELLQLSNEAVEKVCLMVQWEGSFGNTVSDNLTLTVPDVTIEKSDDVDTIKGTNLVISHKFHTGFTSLSFTYDSPAITEQEATHFMSVDGKPSVIPIRPWRFRMYEFIHNYFFRNERVTPFMLPDENGVYQQVFNQYLTNDGDGADSTTPVDFFQAPYEYDLFTTCIKQPTFGNAPLVGVSFNFDESGDTPTGEFRLVREGQTTPEIFRVKVDEDGRFTGIDSYNTDATHPDIHNLQELINFGISISDLRDVSAYQRYKERLVKAGPKYQNIHYEFFGTNPPIGEEFPSYLGGYTDMLRTDKVFNQSAQGEAKLGEYAGNAYIRSSKDEERRQIRHFCSEDSYIMAVCWFSATPVYSQKLDKDFVYSDLLDFYNPQFNNISPQPVYDYQISPLELDPADPNLMKHVFGYNRPFADLVSKQDEAHGLFRTNMSQFILQRVFGGVPKLNQQFLEIQEKDMTEIFAVTDTTDKIFGQIHFDVEVTDTIPHTAIPRMV